jgi:hypothetical protein
MSIQTDLEKIKTIFESRYSKGPFVRYDIKFPEADFLSKTPGFIQQKAGWMIEYIFGNEDGKDFIEIYHWHRMGDPSLYRIFSDGTINHIGNPKTFISYSSDATPDEIQKAEIENREYNRNFDENLKKRGFKHMIW